VKQTKISVQSDVATDQSGVVALRSRTDWHRRQYTEADIALTIGAGQLAKRGMKPFFQNRKLLAYDRRDEGIGPTMSADQVISSNVPRHRS
jgi:hypothetical protein